MLDPGHQGTSPGDETSRVHPVRRLTRIPVNAVGGAPKQMGSADGIASLRMCDTDRDLGEAPPQLAFDFSSCLPGALQNLVRVERATRVEQPLRLGERLVRRMGEIVRHRVNPGRIMPKGPAQLVTRASAARATRGIAVPRTVTGQTHRVTP